MRPEGRGWGGGARESLLHPQAPREQDPHTFCCSLATIRQKDFLEMAGWGVAPAKFWGLVVYLYRSQPWLEAAARKGCGDNSTSNTETLLLQSCLLHSRSQLLLSQVPSGEVVPCVLSQFFLLSLQCSDSLLLSGCIGALVLCGIVRLPPRKRPRGLIGSLEAWSASAVHSLAHTQRGLGLYVKRHTSMGSLTIQPVVRSWGEA